MAKEKNIHAGHRQRMKQEFLAHGLEGWPDHKVLELLLFFSRVQGDTNPLAHALIDKFGSRNDKFGSLTGVFHATHEQLMTVEGVGENTAILIQLVLAVAARYLQERADLSRIYQTSNQFHELLKNRFLGARNELVYMVCLDAKYKKIADFMLGEGIADAATITTRKVMETALACNASIVVLAHNHVSGLALPSAEDVATTVHLKRSLKQVGILLYDHFVFVEDDMVSMRDSGYLTE